MSLLKVSIFYTFYSYSFSVDRTFSTNVPSVEEHGMSWGEFVKRNNPDITCPLPWNSRCIPDCSSSHIKQSVSELEAYQQDLEHALDLLEHLLMPESTSRITARDALYHPFLIESSEPLYGPTQSSSNVTDIDNGDDDHCPHPIGEGVCGQYHDIDRKKKKHRVQIPTPNGDIFHFVQFGEGIPIGKRPCKFHTDVPGLNGLQLRSFDHIVDDENESIGDCAVVEEELARDL